MRIRAKWIGAATLVVVSMTGCGDNAGDGDGPALYRVAGHAMEPTMRDGEAFTCELLQQEDIPGLVPGDIVVVIDRANGDRQIVKRVAAQQGDTIEGRAGTLLLNGAEEFADLTAKNELDDFDAVTVPDGHVFVLGDNFAASADSRSFGPFPYADVQCLVHR